MKQLFYFLIGMFIGLLLGAILIIKGRSTNAQMGRDRVVFDRYVLVNDKWIKVEEK